jgi:hypothetical protein
VLRHLNTSLPDHRGSSNVNKPQNLPQVVEVTIDLSGCEDRETVLFKFGEILVLGGPDGNIPARAGVQGKGWGMNWDALNDSLRSLEYGGIWGTSPKFRFPLKLIVKNHESFRRNQPEQFQILSEVLAQQREEHSREGRVFDFEFV